MTYRFFLAGYDLEMVTIRDLLQDVGQPLCDKRLAWGARASQYREEIEDALARGEIPVLVECSRTWSFPERKRERGLAQGAPLTPLTQKITLSLR